MKIWAETASEVVPEFLCGNIVGRSAFLRQGNVDLNRDLELRIARVCSNAGYA